jgi:polyisoprenyl-phosphate glycosyltransferase
MHRHEEMREGSAEKPEPSPHIRALRPELLSITESQTALRSPATSAEPGRRSLSVVVPMLNEEQGVDRLVERLRTVLEGLDVAWEVIFVDDGSTDATLLKLKAINARDPRFKAISLSRNFGKEIAAAAGLSYVATDAAVLMDADLQHPPELIAKFVEYWRAGYDIVYGQRMNRATDGLLNRWAARAFYAMFRHLSGTTLPEGAGDFRLLDRKAVDAMNRMRERNRFNKGLFAWMGFRTHGVPFHVPARPGGASRWRPRQLLRFGIDGLTAFTTIPLRVWSYLGVAISLFAVCYALVVTVQTLLYGTDVPGYPSLIVSVMFFAGVQLISLGVIGEYLGRMYEEVKGRPLFLVTEEMGIEPPPSAGGHTPTRNDR